MTRTSLDHHNCSFARTVDIIGDRWSLMILRDAFYGVRRFSDFKANLGITQAVLSSRLNSLIEKGILVRKQPNDEIERYEYRLTECGRDLFTTVVAIVNWGDKWLHEDIGPPVLLRDTKTGSAVQAKVVDDNGVHVDLRQLKFAAGPGATEATTEVFDKLTSEQHTSRWSSVSEKQTVI